MMAPYYALRLALAWAVSLAIALIFEGGLLALHLERWWRQEGARMPRGIPRGGR